MGGIKTSRDHQRTLLHFPVVHSQKDMGGFSEAIRKVTLQQLGEKVWRRKINLVERFWEEIGKTIDGLALPYEKTLLYQDGLPVCGREREIVFELARKGSPNHRLLQRLVEKGATLVGTESAPLLIEEYRLVKQAMESENVRDSLRSGSRRQSASDVLLARRDEFIADRIDQTLLPGATGILFLGLLHKIEERLPRDIKIVYPLRRPVDRRKN